MTLFTGSGSIPVHQYVWVESKRVRKNGKGFEKAVWFGLNSHPGRAWGLHVMLEDGAVVRNLPPNAIAWNQKPQLHWPLEVAQRWDCYSRQFSLHRYEYLADLKVETTSSDVGHYLFTAIPLGDGYSEEPEQAKEFMFIRLTNGRLTIQPTNHAVFLDRSFTDIDKPFPTDIRPQTKVYRAE